MMKWLNQLLATMFICSSAYGMQDTSFWNDLGDLPDMRNSNSPFFDNLDLSNMRFSDSPSVFNDMGEFRIFEQPNEKQHVVEEDPIPDDEKELRCDESKDFIQTPQDSHQDLHIKVIQDAPENFMPEAQNPWAAVMQGVSITNPQKEESATNNLVRAIQIFFLQDISDEKRAMSYISEQIKQGADVEQGFREVYGYWPGEDRNKKRTRLLFIMNMRLLRTMSCPFYSCGDTTCYLPHFVLCLLLPRDILQNQSVLGDTLLPEAQIIEQIPLLMSKCPNICAHRINGRPLQEILNGLAYLKPLARRQLTFANANRQVLSPKRTLIREPDSFDGKPVA